MSWLTFPACTPEQGFQRNESSGIYLLTSSGEEITITLAITAQEKIQGLSGIASDQFAADEGMLFVYTEDSPKQFWMPDTYFDLDIFFLDENLKILDVERNVSHHPGREEPPPIARTRSITARHVLEMRADSEVGKRMEVGDVLEWRGTDSWENIIRQVLVENPALLQEIP